ncbi:MAG: hypothetical protein QOJ52_4043 [Acidimicrobiaceae bacterium]|jgi:hypothetical protein|nr:hypothetical protein [Acidimicrobiaceae bacterium]
MTGAATKISRGLFALFTAGFLAVTFYFPLIGLGYALDSSADLRSRGEGLLLLLPTVAISVLLAGMLPPVRGRFLFWLGVGGNLLLLPSLAAGAWLGFPGILGAFVGLVYLAVWWYLARSKLSLRSTHPIH